MKAVKVIGGGLAGVEATYALLKQGVEVELYEMRPNKFTEAHKTAGLAELVCSNSLKSEDELTAQGLLKQEMRIYGSLILESADYAKIPAGGALAVDRNKFSEYIEARLSAFKNLKIIREEVKDFGDYTIIASGPLTSQALSDKIIEKTGNERLHFYDAVAPIITGASVDMNHAFFGARYQKGGNDYLNCPMNKEEYALFYRNLVSSATVVRKSFEKGELFEGCMPVEELARRGEDSLRFGALKPVGIRDSE
ncbi:MAG: methylenetetrahydrofolate--tRNA-(uracil(54)-C(5))-methyltransferase (FADH(2)-oxidizing) TrmFO, partial [Firmicutes bacterium]|nr:methylenetetrahydrofolate--tRNA-(uracil(54)-C(5))-methyltransferase (FADH(2)-oxidizing) TrmFO [Bacillota bacterium]